MMLRMEFVRRHRDVSTGKPPFRLPGPALHSEPARGPSIAAEAFVFAGTFRRAGVQLPAVGLDGRITLFGASRRVTRRRRRAGRLVAYAL